MSVEPMIARLRRLARLTALAGALLALPTAAQAAKPAALSAADKADIARVEGYLNGIGTLQARFLQVAPDGTYAEGTVYLSRPGRMRLDYDPPVPILVVANGHFLIYHDKELKQTSYVGLDQTPAGILLRSQVKLDGGKDIRVVAVERGASVLNVTLRQPDGANGDLVLVFSDSPFALKQWKVIDPQGAVTQVSLFQTQTNLAVDPRKFDFTEPPPGPGGR